MKKINVIDLDKTLLPYDSFTQYLYLFLKKGSIKLLFVIIIRVLRILKEESFKKRAINLCRKQPNYDLILNSFVNKLMKDIDNSLHRKVKTYTDEETINVLCSASPDDYVNKLADRLKWIGIGSSIENDNLTHMYGQNKKKQ